MNALHQPSEYGDTYEEAVDRFRATLEDARRHWVSSMLAQYPHHDVLMQVALDARAQLAAEQVEVNAIYGNTQLTVAVAPPLDIRASISIKSSLCALTVGVGAPVAINDIARDPVLANHPARHVWGAWASVPVRIGGLVAGTVCALDGRGGGIARAWTDRDEQQLEVAAAEVTARVEEWLAEEEGR